jgi:fungal STAND N-terminal Goodbye domain
MDPEMSSNAKFDELWNQALDNYFVAINRSPEDKVVLKGIHNADDVFSQLEAGHGKFGDWRNKHSKFFSALSKGVRPFVLVSAVAQSAVSCTPFAPASTILGAVLFLVRAADGVSEAYEWIENLFEKLSGFTQRLEQYVDASMNAHLQHKVVAILSCLLGILGQSEKVIKDGRFRKYAAVLFLGKDEKVKALFNHLADQFDDEQRLVLAITYATGQRIEKTTEQIVQKIDIMGLSLQGMQSHSDA